MPLRKVVRDGKPIKLNEHGLYVLDQLINSKISFGLNERHARIPSTDP